MNPLIWLDESGARVSDHPPDITPDLVDRARKGHEEALKALIEGAYPLVRRWALVHTGEPADADDLTQDVLVQMLRKLDSFHVEARFTTWLYTVTRNASDRFRRRRRRERLTEERERYADLVTTAVDDVSRELEREELRGLLRAFFTDLPDRQREIFDLVELQGLATVEVAGMLGIEPVSVRAHLFKARRSLRARMFAQRPDVVEELR